MPIRRIVFAGAALALSMFAQNDRGTITGTVSDQEKAVVPNAVVKARNLETGATYNTVTTTTGNYSITQLPVGSYELSVAMPGFEQYVQTGIRVFTAQTGRVDVTLKVGATTESVTVKADASLLKTDSVEQSTTVGVEKLNDLPLNFGANGNSAAAGIRNALTYVTLVPTGTISSYSSIRLNGAPINTFNVQVEGQSANNSRLMIRQDQVQPSVESLEEVSVQTTNFAPEFGQVAGGFVNYTVKSGTNQFHGSVFNYLVNEDLGAGTPYTNSGHGHLLRPPNRRYDFGGSVGGPIRVPRLYDGRNRSFFYFAYEEFYQRQTTNGVLQTVPSVAMRNGDFSGALTGKVLGQDPLGRSIPENTIYDPGSSQTVGGQVVTNPFPNNVIPTSRLDPVALKIQALLPPPTYSGVLNNWNQQYVALTKEYIPTIKLDQYFANRGKLSLYFSEYKGPHYNGLDGLPLPITSARFIATLTNTYRVNYDQPVTPTLLVHLGVGFLRQVNPDFSVPGSQNYDPVAGLGLKGALFGRGFPDINNLFSTSGGGMSLPFGANGAPIYLNKPTAVASAALVRGKHSFKLGADWRIDALTTDSFGGQFGSYSFSNAETGLPYTQGQTIGGGNVGLPYASFLLGYVDSAGISNPVDPQTRKPSWDLYLQDSWRVTSKLTLTYGLRWDYQPYGDELHRRVSAFSPNVPNPSAGGLLGATVFEGTAPGACNCTLLHTYPYAIGPRIGVAYQVLPNTVLRGGWGITYGQTGGGQANILPTLGAGGWNSINWSPPAYGTPAIQLGNGLSYSLAALYNTSLNPGIRPLPGQINSPPAYVDPGGGRPPRVNQWNISLQRQITTDLVVEAAYVGNRGVWLEPAFNSSSGATDTLMNLNAISYQRLAADGIDISSPTDLALLTQPLSSAKVQARGFKAPYSGFPTGQTLAQSLRPYPQFGSITVTGAPLGNTWYDSLQTKLTKRVSHGLDVTSSFVWQKEQADNEGPVNDVFNRHNAKTLSSYSQPLAFVLAFTYRLPALGSNHWVRNAIRDWAAGGIFKYASGLPILSPVATNNLNSVLFQNTYANRVANVPLFLTDLNCGCFDPRTTLVLNPAAWTQPPAGQFGAAAPYYNDYRYARTPSESMNLSRIFRIREKTTFEIRAEFFNIFNRTGMNQPTPTNALATTTHNAQGLLTGGFGYINTGSVLNPPRSGQLVARIEF